MSTEAAAPEATQETEQADAAEFDSGFSAKELDQQPTEKPAADGAQAAPVEEAPIEYVQVSRADYDKWNKSAEAAAAIEDLKVEHKRAIETAFGKMGGFERALAQMQQATPQGYEVEVTDDIVEDLKEDYDDLSAKNLLMLKKFAKKLKGTGPAVAPVVDHTKVTTDAQEAARAEVTKVQMEELADEYPDWAQIVGAPADTTNEYRKWLATQDEVTQRRVNTTNSARVVAKSIADFKAAKAAPASTPKPPSARAAQLRDAVTPRGDGKHQPNPSDQDEFDKGFKTG